MESSQTAAPQFGPRHPKREGRRAVNGPKTFPLFVIVEKRSACVRRGWGFSGSAGAHARGEKTDIVIQQLNKEKQRFGIVRSNENKNGFPEFSFLIVSYIFADFFFFNSFLFSNKLAAPHHFHILAPFIHLYVIIAFCFCELGLYPQYNSWYKGIFLFTLWSYTHF